MKEAAFVVMDRVAAFCAVLIHVLAAVLSTPTVKQKKK